MAIAGTLRGPCLGILSFSETEIPFEAGDLVEEDEIGAGHFGAVVRMIHHPSRTPMAVKKVPISAPPIEDRELMAWLWLMARTATCPHIVGFYGAALVGGECWVSTELMDTSLKALGTAAEALAEDLPEKILAKTAVAVLHAMAFLKDNLKKIYQYVKPSEILLDRRGRIVLADVGVEVKFIKVSGETEPTSLRYMPPEMIGGKDKSSGVTSGVWSLGITLVEMADGEHPYPKWDRLFQLMDRILNGNPPTFKHPERLSEDFINFVTTCLVKEETARPGVAHLLGTGYIQTVDEAVVDVAGYVSRVIDSYDVTQSGLLVITNPRCVPN